MSGGERKAFSWGPLAVDEEASAKETQKQKTERGAVFLCPTFRLIF